MRFIANDFFFSSLVETKSSSLSKPYTHVSYLLYVERYIFLQEVFKIRIPGHLYRYTHTGYTYTLNNTMRERKNHIVYIALDSPVAAHRVLP